jgi:hypothetical protein
MSYQSVMRRDTRVAVVSGNPALKRGLVMKYRPLFAIAVFAWSVLATEAGRAQFVSIDGSSGYETPCPGKKYVYGYGYTGFVLQPYQQAWSVLAGGSIVGSPYANPVQIKWGNTATFSKVSVTVYLSDGSSSDSIITVSASQNIYIKSSPNKSNPSIVGATATAPNFIAIGAPVTFSVPAIPNVNSYVWTFPSCFSPSTTTTGTPEVTVTKTGNCSGTVSVKGKNNSCSLFSQSTSLAIIRGKPVTLPAIVGPDEFCNSSPASYSVPNLPDIDTYHWTIPAGWLQMARGDAGSTIILSRNPTSAPTGTISVYGTLNGFVNSNTVTKTVTIPTAPPPTPAPIGFLSEARNWCPGVGVSFGAALSTGATSYEWAVDGRCPSSTARFFSSSQKMSGSFTAAPSTGATGYARGAVRQSPSSTSGYLSSTQSTSGSYTAAPSTDATGYAWGAVGQSRSSTSGYVSSTQSTSGLYTGAQSTAATRYGGAQYWQCQTSTSRFLGFTESTPGLHTVSVRAHNICGYSEFTSVTFSVLSPYDPQCHNSAYIQ